MIITFSENHAPDYRCQRRDCSASTPALNVRGSSTVGYRLTVHSWHGTIDTTRFCQKELKMSTNTITDWKNCMQEIHETSTSQIITHPMVIGYV